MRLAYGSLKSARICSGSGPRKDPREDGLAELFADCVGGVHVGRVGVLQQVERVADLLSEERSVRLDGLSFAGENGALGIEAPRFGEEEIAGECVVEVGVEQLA